MLVETRDHYLVKPSNWKEIRRLKLKQWLFAFTVSALPLVVYAGFFHWLGEMLF